MMEDELISPTGLLDIMEEQAHQMNAERDLISFMSTVNDFPATIAQAYANPALLVRDLTSPYSEIVRGIDAGDDASELIAALEALDAIPQSISAYNAADVAYTALVNESVGENILEEDEDFTDEEVEEVRLASQSVVATGVGVDEDMNMDELLESALDELDMSPVTPDIVVYDNLPLNSPTISMNETTSRFSSAIWADKISTKKVLLAGIGGIGSYVAYLLSRVDINYLYLFDDDTVEAANLSGQMFNMGNIGQAKVSAMVNLMANFSNFYKVSAQAQRFTDRSSSMDIMICGFDNMRARKDFFHVWKNRVLGYHTEGERANCLFIDGRLAAEEYQIFCIKGDDLYNITRYESDFLFTDEEAEATVCSYKQTSFMANQIASTMVNLFVNYVANQCEPLFDRDLPFYTTYDGITMYFKTES